MKSIEELEKEVWDKLQNEILKERDTKKITLLNNIASNIKRIKEEIERIETTLNGNFLLNIGESVIDPSYVGTKSFRELPPEGTSCRFVYKNKVYQAIIENNKITIFGKGAFTSLSKASRIITNNSRNGWRDWEFRLPGELNWILADTWRRSRSISKNILISPEKTKVLTHGNHSIKKDYSTDRKRLICKGKDAFAEGEYTQNGFIVFGDSTCNLEESNSLQQHIREIRLELIKNGTLIKDGKVYKFIRDQIFNSPSAAACVILARSANGKTEWRGK